MSTITVTRLLERDGDYCSRPARWAVDRFSGGPLSTDYFEVRVEGEALLKPDVYGSTTDLRTAAAWLVGHGVSPRTCDYCDQPATHRVLDATDEVVCRRCLVSQTDGPIRDYARVLTIPQRVRLMVAALTPTP
jgi:hypothetical protein